MSSCVQKAKHTKGTRNVTKEGDADVGESSRVLFGTLFCVMSALGPLQKIRRTRGDRLRVISTTVQQETALWLFY